MKNRYFAIAAGLALTAALAGCAPSAQTGRQASYIDMESAKTAALTAAQVDSADASFTKAELEQDNGTAYYEIEFTDAEGRHSRYAIDAMTGTVIEYQQSQGSVTVPEAAAQQSAASGQISEDEAKRIALADAGVLEGDTAYMNVRLDYDDGVQVFDVEFYVAATSTEYDYEINAADGSIRSMDYDAEGYASSQSAASSGTTKSEQEIRDIALAKVPGATTDDVRLHLDNDDGRLLYEGTIIYQNMKYEFEIDAYSGAVREWDAESVFD